MESLAHQSNPDRRALPKPDASLTATSTAFMAWNTATSYSLRTNAIQAFSAIVGCNIARGKLRAILKVRNAVGRDQSQPASCKQIIRAGLFRVAHYETLMHDPLYRLLHCQRDRAFM